MSKPKALRKKQTGPSAPPPPMSTGKRVVFTAVMIAMPILLLAAAELILRVVNYHPETESLVVVRHYGGKSYYVINPLVSHKYFASHNVGIPEPYEEVFEMDKSPQTFRIFCIGESTMFGYPYPSNVTAPRFLRDRLQTLFPERKFEIINLGIPAVSSSVILDLLKQVVRYQPDLVVVYSGHNEFYGTYGVASTEYVAYNKTFLDLYLQLRHLKLFDLLRNAVLSVRTSITATPPQTRRATFLERMVEDRYIEYRGSKYERARELFTENLQDMVRVARRARVPISFCTTVSNWKDQYPFISLFSAETGPEQRQRWEQLFARGKEYAAAGMVDSALSAFSVAASIDSMRADVHYEIGQCLWQLGKTGEARTEFLRAKDLDALRFRASEEFNDVIRSVANAADAWTVDVEKEFMDKSTGNVLASSLLTEHLHPNVDGYSFMASAIVQSMSEHRQVSAGAWPWARNKSDEEYVRDGAFTSLDVESANIRVQILKSAWPFRHTESPMATFTPKSPLQSIALQYCEKEISWDEAHYRMATQYLRQQQFAEAGREYETVAKELYLFYHPRMLLGDMLVLQGKLAEAEESYLQALQLDPNQFVHLRLGTLLMRLGEFDQAAVHLITAVTIDNTAANKFTPDVRQMAYLALGKAYLEKKEKSLALDAVRQAVAVDPKNVQAQALLRALEASR